MNEIGFEKGLAGLENHLIANWIQLVHEQPGPIGAVLIVVTIF